MKTGIFYTTLCALVLLGARVAVCEAPMHSAQEIRIDNFSFVPSTVTVKAGTTVTWINRDDEPHTVVSTEKKFTSTVMDTDGKYSHTFTEPGTYEYYCSVHPHMKGTIIVK